MHQPPELATVICCNPPYCFYEHNVDENITLVQGMGVSLLENAMRIAWVQQESIKGSSFYGGKGKVRQ